jgi:hypothetical protein
LQEKKREESGVRRYTFRILECGMRIVKGTAEAQKAQREANEKGFQNLKLEKMPRMPELKKTGFGSQETAVRRY